MSLSINSAIDQFDLIKNLILRLIRPNDRFSFIPIHCTNQSTPICNQFRIIINSTKEPFRSNDLFDIMIYLFTILAKFSSRPYDKSNLMTNSPLWPIWYNEKFITSNQFELFTKSTFWIYRLIDRVNKITCSALWPIQPNIYFRIVTISA